MNHDLELLKCARAVYKKPFDQNGDYNYNWNCDNRNHDRITFSRFYYRMYSELFHMYLFVDGSIMITDLRHDIVFHSF